VDLLEIAAQHRIARRYARHLLAAFGTAVDSPGTADDSTPVNQDLVEPLSERELDVLRLLRSDLDGPDIARQLMVSLNTMRTHTKNIYAKLGVNNRRAAVSRAVELVCSPEPAPANSVPSSSTAHGQALSTGARFWTPRGRRRRALCRTSCLAYRFSPSLTASCFAAPPHVVMSPRHANHHMW
jgi:DNA-binding CsgD family transcriptional regulator